MATSREGKVHGIHFEAAEGGLVSHMEKRYARGGQGGGPSYDHETETTVHPTLEHAQEHLEEHLGHVFGKKKGKEKPKAEPKEEYSESDGDE